MFGWDGGNWLWPVPSFFEGWENWLGPILTAFRGDCMEVWSLLGGLNRVMREIGDLCAIIKFYALIRVFMLDISGLCAILLVYAR